ncbi:MAG: hypothetical protein M3297_09790, partial [Thermoproteota archaeon]|nr:hypothetical protein [Thermoproteota archaeon]
LTCIPTSCLLDAYTCNVLSHEVKTCDDTRSSCILVQQADLARPEFPISATLGPLPCLLSVALVLVCLLTMINRNP